MKKLKQGFENGRFLKLRSILNYDTIQSVGSTYVDYIKCSLNFQTLVCTSIWGSRLAYGCGGLSGEGDEHPLGRPAMQPRTDWFLG